MHLENVKMSEVSQTAKEKYHVTSLIRGISEEKIDIISYEVVNSIKITFPRKTVSGNLDDNDIYGCQQHVPLANIEIE